MLVRHREVPGLVVDDHFGIRDMARQPFSVADRREHVTDSVPDLYGDADLGNFESPRLDHREVIVDPAPDPTGDCLAHRSAQSLTHDAILEYCLVGCGKLKAIH